MFVAGLSVMSVPVQRAVPPDGTVNVSLPTPARRAERRPNPADRRT